MVRNKNNRTFILVLALFLITNSCNPTDITYTKLDGIYICKQSSALSGTVKYIVEIDQVLSSENLYIISNFLNQGDLNFIYCEIEEDSLHIYDQQLGNTVINGTGKISQDFNRVTLNYYTDDGTLILDYFAEYSR